MADDLGRKPEPFIRRACSGHDRRSCPTSPSRLTNLTVPLAMRNLGPRIRMSWGALAWATESEVGSSAAEFILILLANKADENFSCYPSIRTLMAESNAGRSTVLRALRDLETRGFISRRPQFHDSGARLFSTLPLPVLPTCASSLPGPDTGPPRPDLGPPGLDSRRTPSRFRTGTCVRAAPPGVPQRDPLNPSIESPSEPSDVAAEILDAATEAWKLNSRGRP